MIDRNYCAKCGIERDLVIIHGCSSICAKCKSLLRLGDGVSVAYPSKGAQSEFSVQITEWRKRRDLERQKYKDMFK